MINPSLYPKYAQWIKVVADLDNVYAILLVLTLIGLFWLCYSRWNWQRIFPVVRLAGPLFVIVGLLIGTVLQR